MNSWNYWELNAPSTTRGDRDMKEATKEKIESLMKQNQDLKDEIESLKKQIRTLERGCACYINNIKRSKEC